MNTADYCPRGRDLYEECLKWAEVWIRTNKHDQQRISAYQAYRQHVDECDICKGVNDAEKES